jgi:hypothetical protein
MRLNQYAVYIPMKTLREALNLSDDITDMHPIHYQMDKDNVVFIVQSDKPLKHIEGRMITTTTLKGIQKKKKPGRPKKIE